MNATNPPRRGLGRGLGSLIPTAPAQTRDGAGTALDVSSPSTFARWVGPNALFVTRTGTPTPWPPIA